MKLNVKNVPPAVASLLPLAEKWGIGDDIDREMKVTRASSKELECLVSIYDKFDADALFDWLEGPAMKLKPSEEYVALTCLTMAIDSARSELKQRLGAKA